MRRSSARSRIVVLALYRRREEARLGRRGLRKAGIWRAVVIHKPSETGLNLEKAAVFPWLGGILGLVLGIGLGLVFSLPLLPLMVLAVFSALGGAFMAERAEAFFSPKYRRLPLRWLLPGETVVLAFVRANKIEEATRILREAGEGVALFFFRPARRVWREEEEEPIRREVYNLERLALHAAQLAAEQGTPAMSRKARPLLLRLAESAEILEEAWRDLGEAARAGQSLAAGAEWFLDNDYLIAGQILEVQRNLPQSYYAELPLLATAQGLLPRVYAMAVELVAHTDGRLDRESIVHFLKTYQSVARLTMGELWAMPLALRLALIENLRRLAVRVCRRQHEHEEADFWANRLLQAAHHDPDRVLFVLAELAGEHPEPRPYFALRLLGHVHDEPAALLPLQGWLERKLGAPMAELLLQEQNRQAADQISIGNAITSLRFLAWLDWKEVFEETSRVEEVLRLDPAGVYGRMDFATRDSYRHAVEELARWSRLDEEEVAREAVAAARGAGGPRRNHVGHYLIGKGRREFQRVLGCRVPLRTLFRQWPAAHPEAVYFGSLGLLTLVVFVPVACLLWRGGGPLLARLLAVFCSLLVASEIGLQLQTRLITRFFPPRALPRLDLEKGIPDEFRTLVVVPMMLLTPESVRDEVHRLEVRFLANQDPNLFYGLVADFADAPAARMPEDEILLRIAQEGIARLNERYGRRFFLFHRERRWNPAEGRFIGWERKRGKIEELNRFLLALAEGKEETGGLACFGPQEFLAGVRFVITLDADTQLPRDTARKLVETIAHPENQPELAPDGRRVREGYTIIQPLVRTSLPAATATYFTRLFSDPTGTDPYCHAVSDVYQDLFGAGTFYGKGLYDLRAFHRVLGGRFPENTILSHDLLEGAYVRVGFATDIVLLDLFPLSYQAYARRQHRWIRGDWQLVPWLWPRVPKADGRKEPNPLTAVDRWKIADNLRRSLVPLGALGLLGLAWAFGLAPAAMGFFVGIMLFLPALFQLPWRGGGREAWRSFCLALARGLCGGALLPHQALLALDAIFRVFYRRYISHRRLLEWETAQMAHLRWRAGDGGMAYYLPFWLLALVSLASGAYLYRSAVGLLPAAAPFLLLWLVSPGVAWLLNRPPRKPRVQEALAPADHALLRRWARRTWRYFDDFVGEETNWLPPDNYQTALQVGLAQRTSPTNIGMWLLAGLAACDLGYLSGDEFVDRMEETFATLARLERYEGHFLNWYDTASLEPLWPRYVSTVDSGNLLACLWTLAQGCRELAERPLFSAAFFAGLADTLAVLEETEPAFFRSCPEAKALAEFLEDRQEEEKFTLLRYAEDVRKAAGLIHGLAARWPAAGGETEYWWRKLHERVEEEELRLAAYSPWLAWVPRLAEIIPAGEGQEDLRELVEAFCTRVPSCVELAADDGLAVVLAAALRANAGGEATALHELARAVAESHEAARELYGRLQRLAEEAERLAAAMNMRFLYDRGRRLFATGYNVSEGTMDNTHYDLLASEARLASFVALCRGDVPVEHWGSLGRPYGLGEGRPVLLSWNGSLFEYLMPLLLQRAYDRSLLKHAAEAAVSVQMAYAARRGIPWGISEAAFSALDARQNYQYRGFGVPGLGLKRGLEEDLVVAPYASALALAVAPAEAVKNLKRLAGLGLYGPYGFYEAIDYTHARCPEGERGVVIYTYMAHHQGMLLLALTNALKDGIMPARFHRDPRVRACESLLFERIPSEPSIIPATTGEGPPPRLMPLLGPAVSEHLFLPNTAIPKAHLLSNGSLTVMVTNAGGGFTRWREIDITRWQADTTQDAHGSFLYLRDPEEDAVWSVGYHPLGHAGRRYGVRFSLDRAEFRRRDVGIETRMEVVVSPEDDAEIRRVTLVNRSGRPRRIELTSYLELALAPHQADRAHPAFQKLFVETEALPEMGALLARRRPRGPEEQEVFAGHLLASSAPLAGPPEYETDRARFIGRGRSLRDPVAMEGPLGHTTGCVLDPIFSLRGTVVIEPGRRVQVAFVTVAAPDRAGVIRLLEKYRELAAVNAAMEMAWSNAQLDIRHLRVGAEEAHYFQELGSHILYPNPRLRPASERLRLNKLGQPRLWAYGISGDLPIICLVVTEAKELPLVQEVLLAHTYLRLRGLAAELVILNGESPGYEQPLGEELRRLILAHSFLVGQERPGGVFLRSLAQMPEEDQTLLFATARVLLVGARGSLAQQLAIPQETPELPERLAPSRRPGEEPTPPLPFMALEFFNGYGGFTPDGREYVIYLEKEKDLPAPWVNVLANPLFGAIVSESGTGLVWYGNSQMNRLTPWSNDPLLDPPSVVFYLRDEETGEVWTPTVRPLRTGAPYRIQHGQGYTVFAHNYRGIEAELLVFLPTDPAEPVLLQRLRLRNVGERPRRLGVFVYLDWVLGTWREETQMHVVTRWDAESGALLARNAYHAESGERIAFASLVPTAVSYTADRTEFIGRNRSPARPAALERVGLARRTGAGLDPCAAEMAFVELEPGASTEVYFLLGEAEELNEYRRLVRAYRDPYRIEEAFMRTRAWWERVLTAVQVETPDRAVNYLLNRWLLYQTLSCRLWARSSFYQSGGAIGFRDQLQDALALLYAEPRLAREQILLAAGRQFVEGDVQHWWHPGSGAGTRTRCSDDLVWLVYAVCEYIRHTGEEEILDLRAPFLEGRPLAEGEGEAYLVPNVAMEDGTILEHCRRALRRALRRGPHGLPLIGTGDWNDGLNRVGKEGRGESVWLGWFLVHVLTSFAEVCRSRAPELAEECRQEARELVRALEETAWDGSWYLRAFFDDGTPLGSAGNMEARIDLLPQAWAAIAGLGDPARARQAVLAAERELVRGDPPLVALFAPPFAATTLDPGYIKAYPPGVRENGGQYTHGALWLAMALARLDEPDRAYRVLKLLNPIERSDTPEEAERYRTEPYVVASDVYAAPDRFGQGGWTWYTGSSGWMYRIWLEEILGFRRQGDQIEFAPRLPALWPGYRLRYRFGETWYEVKVEKPEGATVRAFTVEYDGRPMADGRVPLADDGGVHAVLVRPAAG